MEDIEEGLYDDVSGAGGLNFDFCVRTSLRLALGSLNLGLGDITMMNALHYGSQITCLFIRIVVI